MAVTPTTSTIFKSLATLKSDIEADPVSPLHKQRVDEIYIDVLRYARHTTWKTTLNAIPCESLLNKSIELISNPDIQGNYPLKRRLSLICSFFARLTSAQCLVQNIRLYESTINKWQADIKALTDTLPNREVSLRAHLECTDSAIHMINKGAGRWQELAKRNTGPLVIGALKCVADRSVSSIVEPIANLVTDLYTELHKRAWYQVALSMQFEFSSVIDLKDIDSANLRSLSAKHLEKDTYGICLGEIFWQLIQDPSTSLNLKKRVLNGDTENGIPSFKVLAGVKKPKTPLWKVRCQSVSYLMQLCQDPQYSNDCHEILAERLLQEKNLTVHDYLVQVYRSNRGNPIWSNTLKQVDRQVIHTKSLASKLLFSRDLEEIQASIESFRNSQNAPDESFYHAASSETVDEDELEASSAELRDLEVTLEEYQEEEDAQGIIEKNLIELIDELSTSQAAELS